MLLEEAGRKCKGLGTWLLHKFLNSSLSHASSHVDLLFGLLCPWGFAAFECLVVLNEKKSSETFGIAKTTFRVQRPRGTSEVRSFP